MTIHVCFDLETLSTKTNALVLSAGFCVFDDEKWQPFDALVDSGVEMFFDRDSQLEAGLDVEESTIKWWQEQGEEAQRVLLAEDTIHPRSFHSHWQTFCSKRDLNTNWITKNTRFFVRGPHFDVAILQTMLQTFNVSTPWKYAKVRDIRTWLECHGLDDNLKLKKPETMVAHNALHDAAFDAYMMLEVMHKSVDQLEVDYETYKTRSG